MTDADSPYWTVEETAKYLRIHERTVYEMLRRGQLDYVRIGRTKGTRILGASVERLIRTGPAAS